MKKQEKDKIKSEKLIEKAGLVIILLTIVLLNIFIGSNIKDPIWLIQMIVSVFTAIYLIASKINKKKNIIIKSKIDIAVLIFVISTILPYIFRTNVTLEGTINFILKYWAVYGFYILIRNIINTNKKREILINTIIISSIIPIIFGIDKLTLNISKPVLEFINSVKIDDTRMISTFGYANTFAIYLVITTSLAIAKLINTDKKKTKILYAIYILISSITIVLTQSKLVLALVAITIFIFIIKGIKEKKISKKWIIGGIVFIIAFFIYFFIAIQIDKPLKITEEEKNCVIRNIEPNTNYKFELDINSKSSKEYNTYEITIVEVTRYFSERYLDRVEFGKFEGTKILSVETSEFVDHIEIRIKNKLKQEITINDLKINGKKYILEYKIIPEELVRIFTTFNFKNSSVWQRGDYWRDGIEILQNNWLIGQGGNTWRICYGQVQDYLYYAKEGHCYILEVWMSFGIIGILSYIFIIAITIQNGVQQLKESKQNRKDYRNIIAMFVGILLLIIHSTMDFDMSYLIMEMIFFTLIALINSKDSEIKNSKSIIDICVTVIFVIITIGNILGFSSQMFEDETGITSKKIAPWISRHQYNQIVHIENNKIQDKNKINYIKEYIKNEPYQKQNIMYEIMSNEIINNSEARTEENIEYLIDIWKNIEPERKYEITTIQKRAEIMLELSENLYEDENLKNYAKEIAKIIVEEYSKYKDIITDYIKNGEAKKVTEYKYEYYTDTYNKAIKLLKIEDKQKWK